MVHIIKFKPSTIRIGQLEGALLYRIIVVSSVLIMAIFLFGYYGFIVVAGYFVFGIRIDDDFIDEYVIKKLKGEKEVELPDLFEKYEIFELYVETYGYSSYQDEQIINEWTNFIITLKSDFIIIRFPYKIPIEDFKTGIDGYDSLFSKYPFFAEAYFIGVSKDHSGDFEKTASVSGIHFRKLENNEVKELNDLI